MSHDRPFTSRESTYRMIAIDLDGTLLSPTGKVSPRTRDAVHRALEAGLLICFATGRNWTESKVVLDAVGHYATAVFVGGAMIVDTKGETVLHRTLMEPDLARALCRALEDAGQAALALQDTSTAGVEYLITADVELNDSTTQWMNVTQAAVHRVYDLRTRDHSHTVRVGIVAAPEVMAVVRSLIEKQFGARVFVHCIKVPAYGVEVLEVFDPSVNKWEGIRFVAERHCIARGQIIAIGDDVNDIHMIREAGLGVAMGNALPEIKALAKRIIGTNKDDGLARFLDELVESHAVEPERRGEH